MNCKTNHSKRSATLGTALADECCRHTHLLQFWLLAQFPSMAQGIHGEASMPSTPRPAGLALQVSQHSSAYTDVDIIIGKERYGDWVSTC